ncbi:hypothetical protein F3Y22_tig00110195pilonHSYRG00033 [Hibiscus syriacus]|uniref:Uncharacterized protein n=1 Tax=Hibiscus syriacus TaxID=106335 RepID=A0A6A3BHH4_HIBSY|nr:hypothetical protein F3Y22_tig00110195pilonHSYRG00033 [Hibiscus syriacus]
MVAVGAFEAESLRLSLSSSFLEGNFLGKQAEIVVNGKRQAKDVVKALKRRLQHKISKVQSLALTLLETIVKNCGDYVHFKIAERNVLGKMVKIVRRHLVIRGEFGSRISQAFIKCSSYLTPPATHPNMNPDYGMPSNSFRRLEETMATDIESLSLSNLDSMRDVMELLSDMLQVVNPSDSAAVKGEVIVDLVNQCHSNQKKLMQMLTTTGDGELLARCLELNHGLQSLLAKNDAIAVGSPLPVESVGATPKPTEAGSSNILNEVKSPTSSISPLGPVDTEARSHIDEEEEEEDDFAQLARRHSRAQFPSSQSTFAGTSGATVPINNATAATSFVPTASTSIPSNALALPDPPAPVRTSKEQDLIDLLSLTLSTTSASTPHTPPMPSVSHQNMHQGPVTPNSQGYPYASLNSSHSIIPHRIHKQNLRWTTHNLNPRSSSKQNPKLKTSQIHRLRPKLGSKQKPDLNSSQNPHPNPISAPSTSANSSSAPSTTPNSKLVIQTTSISTKFSASIRVSPFTIGCYSRDTTTATRPLQHNSSLPARGTNGGSPMNGDSWTSTGPATGQKPFIPSYRLFEDLNVLGNADRGHKMTNSSSTSHSLSGTNTLSMVGGEGSEKRRKKI